MSDSKIIEKKKAEARKLSIKEGCFSTIQSGLGDTYVAPYALALQSSNFQIAMLSSIPSLLGPLTQKFGSRLIEKYSRKKIVVFSVIFQSLTWLPMILLAFLFWKGIWVSLLPLLLVIFFSTYVVFGDLAGPAWFSWMGDIVNENQRGKYFSLRNRITGFISLIATLIGAFFLDFFKNHSWVLLGFVIFFFIAMTSRFIASMIFRRKYEPKIKLEKNYYFSFWQFMKKASKNNFGRFSIYVAFLRFATAIGGPFFVVYMLKDLGFSYVVYILITITGSAASLLVLPLLGRFSDKKGNQELMKLSSFFIGFFPVLWLFSHSPVYLALIPQLISSVAWTGFNLAAGNFIYDSVTPQKRGLCVSYYNILGGVGVFLGATLGGLLAKYLQIKFMNVLLFIFLISAVARTLTNLIFLPKIREVRKVEKFSSARALKNLVVGFVRLPIAMHQTMFEVRERKRSREKKV